MAEIALPIKRTNEEDEHIAKKCKIVSENDTGIAMLDAEPTNMEETKEVAAEIEKTEIQGEVNTTEVSAPKETNEETCPAQENIGEVTTTTMEKAEIVEEKPQQIEEKPQDEQIDAKKNETMSLE